MGKEEDSQAEANDLSGGQEAHRGGSESKVGEGEEGRVVAPSATSTQPDSVKSTQPQETWLSRHTTQRERLSILRRHPVCCWAVA